MNAKPLPLDGIKVIDFTQVMMGPCATQMLADYGADVIKIERPGTGDLSRTSIPNDPAGLVGPVFCSLNRNKRSIVLDTRKPEARDAALRLIERSDIVVSNFRAGVMDRMGFGYEALARLNPRLIYAVGTGYGLTGPYAHKGGQDVLAQAMSGVMARRSDPSVPLALPGTAFADYAAGMHLVQGVLLALLQREKTGRGQLVAVSLLDSMVAAQMQEGTTWLMRGRELNWAAMPLSGVFETRDGAVVMVGAFKTEPLRGDGAAGARRRPALRDLRAAGSQSSGAPRHLPRALPVEHHGLLARAFGNAGSAVRPGASARRRPRRPAGRHQRDADRGVRGDGKGPSRRLANSHVGGAGHDPDRAAAARSAHQRGTGRNWLGGSGCRLMPVRLDVDDHIARVTIDRPDVLNAIDQAAEDELQGIWQRIEHDRNIRVVVLTGTGDRAFCAGADMKSMPRLGGFGGIALRETLDVPVIARVNGHALGGGFEMMLGCDIVVAAEEATFGLPEPRVGRLPLDGGMTLLARQIPFRHAMALLLTGRRIKASEALRLGIVNEVVPRANLDAAVTRWIDDVLACAPLSLRAIKQMVRRTAHLAAADAQAQRLPALVEALRSRDAEEGVRAFREKRPPVWEGR